VEEWAIRAGIAIGAALIGAILRPYVEDRFRRRQQSEERIRERNRAVREMVEKRIAKFRRELHFAGAIGALIDAGASGDQAFKGASQQAGPIFSLESNAFWQPARISDAGVKYLCDELDLSIDVLLKLAVGASRGRKWERDELLDKLPYEDPRLKRLEEMIVARMDQVGW